MTASFKPVSVAIGDLTAHPANVRSNSPETYDSENIAHLNVNERLKVTRFQRLILTRLLGAKAPRRTALI